LLDTHSENNNNKIKSTPLFKEGEEGREEGEKMGKYPTLLLLLFFRNNEKHTSGGCLG